MFGDFNLDPCSSYVENFLTRRDLYNLVHFHTCFKSQGSCIDLILTNKKHSFLNTKKFETGLSDHHLVIYSMLKTKWVKEELSGINYSYYKNFNIDFECLKLYFSNKGFKCNSNIAIVENDAILSSG